MVKVIVGMQWGDEGKGRATHYESKNVDLVIRATGGNNAGHTVVANGKKYAMHLLPSSIIRPEVVSTIGPGVVVDLEVLNSEIEEMQKAGIKITAENFLISERAYIILPHHKQMDAAEEELKGKNKVGTTGRGIGPTYESKAERVGPRMWDLVHTEHLMEKIQQSLRKANIVFQRLGYDKISAESEYDKCMEYSKKLKKYIGNLQKVVNENIRNYNSIIVEGAQGLCLDIDHGDRQMVTSSNPNASGSVSGAGIGPTFVNEVIGVMKAYCSKVGEGAFPTELNNVIGDRIRELGHEYGTTTGRPRRCGWLDLVLIKNARFLNGVTGLCLNHIDTIGRLGAIKVCTQYEYNGETIEYVPFDLENCKPIYQTFKGWEITRTPKRYEDLPINARRYIEFIEEYACVKVKYIGIGPAEEQTIIK